MGFTLRYAAGPGGCNNYNNIIVVVAVLESFAVIGSYSTSSARHPTCLFKAELRVGGGVCVG
jgi:hypothetical protein